MTPTKLFSYTWNEMKVEQVKVKQKKRKQEIMWHIIDHNNSGI